MADGSIIYEKGTEIKKVNLTNAGTLEITGLPVGCYELYESQTLEGLVLNEKRYEIKFTQKDTITKIYEKKLEIENETTLVEFSKKSITGEDELPGAKLTVLDENGNKITSGNITNGKYTVNLTPKAGTYYYTFEYLGNDMYNASKTVERIDVAKDKIRVDIYTLKALTTNTTVKLVITDSVKSPVNSGFISVVDSKGNVVSSGRVVNGIYMINMTPPAGAQKFTIKYSGDDTYKAVNIIKTIYVVKDKSTVKNLATTSQLNNLNSNITIEVSV